MLENFHTVTLIHMLRRHNFDYLLGGGFGHLGDEATSFRKVLERSILSTDMSRHFAFVSQINDMGRRFGENKGASKDTIEDDRLLLCSGLIKCADISNPVCCAFLLSLSLLDTDLRAPSCALRLDHIEYRERGRRRCYPNGQYKRRSKRTLVYPCLSCVLNRPIRKHKRRVKSVS